MQQAWMRVLELKPWVILSLGFAEVVKPRVATLNLSEVLKLPLGAGSDKNVAAFFERTALYVATENGCAEVMKLLLVAAADRHFFAAIMKS